MITLSSFLPGKKMHLTAVLLSVLCITGFTQTNRYVSPAGNDLNSGLSGFPMKTIQGAVSSAADGDIINVANGNYSLTATLNLNHSLTITGESESGVIINTAGTPPGAWAINPNRSNTSISNLTIIPNGTTGGYPIHVGANTGSPLPVLSNISLSHITINGAKKTAFDINGVTGLTLSYLTAKNTISGNGVQVSGCWNVTADHITTSNNTWGAFAIYVSTAVARGSDHVNIDAGSSSFGEIRSVYSQDESGFFNTNISVPGDNYTVQNTTVVGYTYYFADKTMAISFAGALPNPGNSSMRVLSGNQFIVTPPLKIQAAINAASAGDMINVYPAIYTESAPGSTLFNGGTYTFGLFLPASKPGISIIGVDINGVPVSSYSGVVAHVQANATNNFGPSGVFVEADNITIAGLDIYLDPAGSQNKTVEVIGENFTMKNAILSDGNSLYINDWRYDAVAASSHITKYRIEGNRFAAGTSLDISSGAGKSGPVSGRQVLNNFFDAAGGNFALISFNGSGTGVPWFTYSVGGAVISGNQFVHGEQYIRHRGTVDNSQFDWNQYWNNNSFDKSVITLADEAGFIPRAYSYANSYGIFSNVKRIGALIQPEISNVAQNGDLVKLGAGTFAENITVTKEVEIRGKTPAVTKIIPAISNPDCGGSGGGSLCAGASNIFLVQANNVTIDQLQIDGDNPAISSSVSAGGADIDARNGIITNHTAGVYNNLIVHHVQMANIFLRGIYASSGGTFNFSDNRVSNVQGNSSAIALFNFGGAGSFLRNTVNNAGDAIASNWSKGSLYANNLVLNSGSGIHTDNNGGGGGNADIIQDNQVINSTPGGYGIWVFAPYRSVLVKNNAVNNVDVGFANAGQQAAVTTSFIGNLADGQHKTGSTGVYVTTDLFGFGTSHATADFQNNFIQNNTDGFYLESQAGEILTLTAHSNAITGNSHFNVIQGVGVHGAGAFSADMKCNWWGTADAAGITASVSGAAIDHSTWLANGTDNDLSMPGFQPAGICSSPVSNARVTSLTNIFCYGSSTGSAVIAFDNGFAPVVYALDGGTATTAGGSSFTLNGLAAGSHTVIMTDGSGAGAVVKFNITQPSAALNANFSFTPILCNGGLSVQHVMITGGTAPYTMTNQGGGIFISGAGEGITYSGNTYAADYVYKVTDANGCQYTFNVSIPQPAALHVSSSATAISCNGSSTITVTATGGTAAYTGTGTFIVPAGTYSYTVTDANGCSAATAITPVIIPDTVVPVITAIADQSFCINSAGIYTIPVLAATDNCGVTDITYVISGATSRTGSGANASGAFNTGVSLISWTVKDASNNTSTSATNVTVNPLPVVNITVSNADNFCNKISLTTSSSGSGATYTWLSGSSHFSTAQQISLGQTNGDGVYSVTATVNGCTGTAAAYNFQKQNLISSYTILASDAIELGTNNTVASGSVGVTSPWGKVELNSNSSVSSPGSFVKAKYIDKHGSNISIANPLYSAATGIILPTMLYNTANTNSLPNKEVAQNSTSTVNGNYKKLTLKKGSRTILTGTIFGSIRVEQGAQVTFTATTLNIGKLQVVKGPRYGYSYVRFAQNTLVLVSGSVTIGSQVYINPDNNKVTFYMGDKKNDDERFTVKGGDTRVTANIYLPDGNLKVTGGYRYGDYGNGNGDCDRDDDDDRYYGQGNSYVYMTGTFIAEEVEGDGRNVIWNSFDCSSSPVALINNTATTQTVTAEKVAGTTEEELKVTVMPNPSTSHFTLQLESKSQAPVTMRVMDGNGRVVDARSNIGSNSTIQIGANYSSGTYYAEMIQGTRRKMVQLIKGKG